MLTILGIGSLRLIDNRWFEFIKEKRDYVYSALML